MLTEYGQFKPQSHLGLVAAQMFLLTHTVSELVMLCIKILRIKTNAFFFYELFAIFLACWRYVFLKDLTVVYNLKRSI